MTTTLLSDGRLGSALSTRPVKLSVLMYGPPGTGKTTAALRATGIDPDKRVLLIDAEAGAQAMALSQHGVDPDRIDVWLEPSSLSFDAMEAMIMDLQQAYRSGKAPYSAIVVDSMTELTKRLLDNVTENARAKAERIGRPRDRWTVELGDYGVASSQLRLLLRRLRDLPTHLVLTALERRDVDDDGLVSYGPAMGPAAAIDTTGLVDIVGRTSVDQVGDSSFYTATFVPINRRKAKDRLGVLPGKMADPGLDRIWSYATGELTRGNDPIQAALRAAAAGPAPTEPATTADPESARQTQ